MEKQAVDKHELNKQTNKLLKSLLKVLKNYTEEDKPKIEKAIKTLEKYSKAIESEFLNDVTYIIKYLYTMKDGEKK